MSKFFLQDAPNKWHQVQLGPAIAQGAAGTIHRVIGQHGIVAKVYKDKNGLAEYKEKIAAMLAAPPDLPPISYQGRNYVQIAWPSGNLFDEKGVCGFVMPEVDLQTSTELHNILQKATRQRKRLPEFYAARVHLAANLSALTAELHALQHYMIDMKPANIRFYPGVWYMAILDTDGFCINGTRRFTAQQFSDEYIAPEARGLKPDQLGLEQDLFALAVIIFQLLNNGLHPFQGIDRSSSNPTTLQERIFAKLYSYSAASQKFVKPPPLSIYDYFEDKTRALFDRAFQTPYRPTAAEWRDHLRGLFSGQLIVNCVNNPKEHQHFSKGCGICALGNSIRSSGSARPIVQTSSAVLHQIKTAQRSTNVSARRSLPRIPGTSKRTITIAIGGALMMAAYTIWGPTHSPTVVSPANVQNAPERGTSGQETVSVQGGLEEKSSSQVVEAEPGAVNPTNPLALGPTVVQGSIVVGRYLDESGNPKFRDQIFYGNNPPITSKVIYEGANPNNDYIEMKLSYARGSEALSCGRNLVEEKAGYFYCDWTDLGPGKYEVAAYLNENVIAATQFEIKPPQRLAVGEGCESAPITTTEKSTVWGSGCAIGNQRWRYWCLNGITFDYPEDQDAPAEGFITLCGPVGVRPGSVTNGEVANRPVRSQ